MDRTPAHPAASKPRIRMRGCGRGNGFTLVELLLAISGTMLVGLAVVSLMAATRYGTDSNQGPAGRWSPAARACKPA